MVWRQLAEVVADLEPIEGYAGCAAHGDLAPWNARIEGSKLWLFDWECFLQAVPQMYEPIHFNLRVSMLLHRLSAPQASRRLASSGLLRPRHAAESALALAYMALHPIGLEQKTLAELLEMVAGQIVSSDHTS